jgi:hypothetical protein
VIYVLDAGMKKSPKGGKIPQQQVNRLVARKKSAVENYAKNKAIFAAEYAGRLRRRKAGDEDNKPQPH